MQVIYHAWAIREELSAKGLPRIVDGLAERFVEVPAGAAHLYYIGVIQAQFCRLHTGETLRTQMDLLFVGHQILPGCRLWFDRRRIRRNGDRDQLWRRNGNRAPNGGSHLRQQFESSHLHCTPAVNQRGDAFAGQHRKNRNPGIGCVCQQFDKRCGNFAWRCRRDQRVLRFRGSRQGRRLRQGNIDAVARSNAIGDTKQNGPVCQAGGGIREGGAKLAGIRCDAQAADRLVQLLRLFPPRVIARTFEENFEFGGNFRDALFKKLTRARRHC